MPESCDLKPLKQLPGQKFYIVTGHRHVKSCQRPPISVVDLKALLKFEFQDKLLYRRKILCNL